jgi:hypothetical protein
MALVSPGVEVTIIDQSQYIPAATNSVPYILLATASNKVSGAGTGIAAGTLAANANKVYLITSQRDLAATYGVPFFYQTTTGTPINGYELNEYGLLAAYSALGLTNRCYVQRVDIDLAELTASLVRPTGTPPNGTYWLDTANTQWGIFQWNQTTGQFTNQVPTVITSTTDLETASTVPLQTIGSIGDYAIVAATEATTYNPVYYKRGGPTADQTTATALSDLYNNWVLVGSNDWKTSWPTITGTLAPTTVTGSLSINGVVVTWGTNTVDGVMAAINTAAISGVYAANIGGKLAIYANYTAQADGSSAGEGAVYIANVSGTPLATLGITSSATAGTYFAPAYLAAPSYENPRWGAGQPQPEPTGSVWIKYNSVNLGTKLIVKKYNSTLGTFVAQTCPVYTGDFQANYALDPSGGGQYIPAGATYAAIDTIPHQNPPQTASFQLLERYATGPTNITGDLSFTSTATPFTPSDTFTIVASQAGTAALGSPVTVTIGGTGTIADFVAAVSAANVPHVSASVSSAGNIVMQHSQGGTMNLRNIIGTPVTDAGFNTTVRGCREGYSPQILTLSNWVTTPTFTYTASTTAPDQDPANGRLWYYSAATNNADIMIQNNGAWMGYQMVTNDIRGENLTLTNAAGPIFSTTAPTTQTDDSLSPLQHGDLWIDTSDLENYPMINRWENVNGVDQWVMLDNTDQTSSNGVLFADARWAPNGDTNPITDPIPTISSLLVSDYLDLDAPDPALYPQGMLLFNTRRSGFNVKKFESQYFTSANFPGDNLPAVAATWITAAGNRADGSPYMGRQAQRALIVDALKAGIDGSTQIREEIAQFNLIACPQYPELAPNMVALNNERGDTAFTIVDTPLRLSPADVVTWSTNNNGLGLATGDGLLVGDAYAGAFYPSCETNDLSGNTVVQPPSHMMVRTIISSDQKSYPWLAPAGVNRGVVTNAFQIGYVNGITGEFVTLGVNQGLRDVLYTNRVNPITFVPGAGIVNFGNKTTTSTTSALDRINVARLVAFLRGRLTVIAKQYLFQPNDTITRQSIASACTSLMIDLVAKRGIYDYLVVCDLSNNTPTTIDRNELYVDIAIEPVKAVEFIYIPVRIQNTGTIASATVV